MKHVYLLNLLTVFVIIRLVNTFGTEKQNVTTRVKLMKLHCLKSEHCQSDDQKVCGFNEDDAYMAVFENSCSLYQMNCKGHGFFAPIRIEFCRAKLKYDTEHANETFEWVHVLRNDSTSTTEAIALHPKNETVSLPKRGIIIQNTRRHKHKRRKHRSKKRTSRQPLRSRHILFHESLPIHNRIPKPYPG